MTRRAKIMSISVAAWSVACAAAAWLYVSSVLAALDTSAGYESTWQFQLFAFALVRFPLWLMLLVVLLVIEAKLLKVIDAK